MYQQQIRIGGPLTAGVKFLLIFIFAVFCAQLVVQAYTLKPILEGWFSVSYGGVFERFFLWQPFTYQFLHYGILHIAFNMLGLWMFGGELEQLWGTKRFLRYYLLSGLFAGLFIMGLAVFMHWRFGTDSFTLGASGALYAILLAYALNWPDREILLFFVIPIKMKYFVLLFGVIEFLSTLSSLQGTGGGVSHIGHIGGLAGGFLIYQYMFGWIHMPFLKKLFSRKKKQKIRFKIVDNSEKAKRIIDKMLDKIAKNGIESLTPDERKELEWARKNYYPGGSETLH